MNFKGIICLIFCLTASSLLGQSDPGLKLWYDEPADTTWENALPIGNGFLGAMVYGNVNKEIIQLNETTVWSGSPNENDNPNALTSLDEIRKLIFSGEYKAAQDLANKDFITKKSNGQRFQPVGNLEITFEKEAPYTDYYRDLDLSTALASTSYRSGGIRFQREMFASLTEKVIAVRLSADQAGSLNFALSFACPHKIKEVGIDEQGRLRLSGITGDHEGVTGKLKFESLVEVKLTGGKLEKSKDQLKIMAADEAIILITVGTNFINYENLGGDASRQAVERLAKASNLPYSDLKSKHISAYKKYFDRVSLDLGLTEAANLPTDERLANFRNTNDPHFISLYYQYGRYLLISSSQPGGQPANLQGIWNHKMSPPWDSKYTININTEMNYWPAEKTNLSELHRPLIEMVKDLSVTGSRTARVMYGARGWMAHHNTDLWRIAGPVDGAFWGIWNAGGAWLSQHLWEHYLYSGDKNYLKEIYPVLKGAAMFYNDFLVDHPVYGFLVVCPANSPENAPKAHQGASIDGGTTMDNQIVFDVLSNAIRAAQLLGDDDPLMDTLLMKRAKLSPMHIGKHNQLQEWLDDVDDPNDHHRHISHLYGLYPSNQISAYKTPQLFEAARNTLIQRGDVSTGWSMGWKVNWWAHLLDGDHAFKLIENQLTPLGVNQDGGGTYNNLFDAHPPFQIDGNFGCTSGITEMLVQSSKGELAILPALPSRLSKGRISGVRARGGFTIEELEWENGQVKRLKIRSNLGGNLRIRVGNELVTAKGKKPTVASGENTNPFYETPEIPVPIISIESRLENQAVKPGFLYDQKTKKGRVYEFVTP